jgi:GrpB-like predicted nucleotidyltransferase (UPF0157 family)
MIHIWGLLLCNLSHSNCVPDWRTVDNSDYVILAQYSPKWPLMYEAEAEELRDAFLPEVVAIEHVGSTAVPGMSAKPIVDILLGATSLAVIEARIECLASLGYRYVPEFEKQLPQRRYFVKPAKGEALFHLHAVGRGSAFWREQLAFRDALRSSPELFAEYLALKQRLAKSFHSDRAAYTDGKTPFVREVLNGQTQRS